MKTIEHREKQEIYPRKVKDLVRIVKAADKEGQLVQVVAQEVSHPFSMPALWECREYIHKIPEESYHVGTRESVILVSARALLATMEGDLDGAKNYVSILGEAQRDCPNGTVSVSALIRMQTELVMPYLNNNQFLHNVLMMKKMGLPPVQSLTLSASRPSIINGFRDFTPYGKYLTTYRDMITDLLNTLYGEKDKGVFEIIMAEWCYQQNDSFRALILVTGTIPVMENKQDIQCLFVAMALQMRILLLNGQMQAAAPLVAKIRERIRKTGWEELTSSLNALEAWAACYDGNRDIVKEWLIHAAPDETKDFYMMDMYAYLVKIRCYLMVGKDMLAILLAKQLIGLLEAGRRYMDLCECYMLSAIACYKAGCMEDMCTELDQALRIARKYHYLRLLADEGIYMVRMLQVYCHEKGNSTFTDEIMSLASEVAKKIPDYLKSQGEYYEPLTPTEKKILKLMAQGMSYQEMAENLDKKIGTLKFHSSGIFRKLQVKNRQQAVKRAGEIGLL